MSIRCGFVALGLSFEFGVLFGRSWFGVIVGVDLENWGFIFFIKYFIFEVFRRRMYLEVLGYDYLGCGRCGFWEVLF